MEFMTHCNREGFYMDNDSIRVSFEAEAKEDCEPERPYLRNGDPGTPEIGRAHV